MALVADTVVAEAEVAGAAELLPIKLLLTGKMGSGKSFASRYLRDKHGAVCWSRTELMKPLAHALLDGTGELEALLKMVFPDEEDRDDVRHQLLVYIAEYELEKGKKRRLYQDVVEICQQHDPYCFEVELEKRMKDAGHCDFQIIDDVRVKEAFEYFSERDYSSVRIEADEVVRKYRMIERDGVLPALETLNHYSETALDAIPHDFVIVNNGDDLELFYKKLDHLVELLRSGKFQSGAARIL